jgi:hypothetical protein
MEAVASATHSVGSRRRLAVPLIEPQKLAELAVVFDGTGDAEPTTISVCSRRRITVVPTKLRKVGSTTQPAYLSAVGVLLYTVLNSDRSQKPK